MGPERAGTTASALYTVLQSARLQQIDLLPYLTDVLRGMPAVERGDVAGHDVYLPDRCIRSIVCSSANASRKTLSNAG